MIVTIHQPEHLPWLGFFDKLNRSDVWVMLDHVQYERRGFQNRNRSRNRHGAIWINVPVNVKGKYHQPINQVQIDNAGNPRWKERCWNSIFHCYGNAPFFTDHSAYFQNLYQDNWEQLVDLNQAIIRYLINALGIEVAFVRSSGPQR